jgi:succinylglutamic semialdehyde dehydrogenase
MYSGDFINNVYVKSTRPDERFNVVSPADFKDVMGEVMVNYSHVDQAVEAAHKAFPAWRDLKKEKRFEYLNRLSEIFLSKKEVMAETISRETGKPLWEATGEASALVAKIKVTLEHSMKLVEDQKIPSALPGEVDGWIRFRPKGVMAVVGPFNFPAHLPNGHIIPALATGNTVVFKPSDKTPFTGQVMADCFKEAGFPDGVFNLVQGQVETGRRLVGHKLVSGVLFTGSYGVGLKIKQDTLEHYWKSLALEMGGKNSSIIWEDADIDKAIYESLMGAYLTAGQRCSCTSIIHVHESKYDEFLDRFYKAAKKIKIGHWKEKDVFMGPLISEEAVEKYLRFQQIALREGAECVMRGKKLEDLHFEGNYVTPSVYTMKSFKRDSVYLNQEIFGPNIAVLKAQDLEETLDIVDSSEFGLVSAIFTKDKKNYERALAKLNVGLLNWNRTTNGASSRLPFGGSKKSGNYRPSAHHAVYYCTVPVASLEDPQTMDDVSLPPGLVL